MSKKITVRALALMAGGVLCFTALPLSACGGNSDSIIVMAEEFSGLFSPFYATSGADIDVVGMTQLSMLTSDSKGNIVAGENEATVVLDYDITEDGGDSVYTFVLKNGLKFSDGKPLTMNDVMFNIYEYLDPVYTGSSTMYSTKIKGLTTYRTQQAGQEGDDSVEASISNSAYSMARNRRAELDLLFRRSAEDHKGVTGSGDNQKYYSTPKEVRETLENYKVSDAYMEVFADGETASEDTLRERLLADYELVLEKFEKELNDDFSSAKEAFDLTTAPYKGHDEFNSDIFKFLYFEGIITPVYATDPVTHKTDKTTIKSFDGVPDMSGLTDQKSAVAYAFDRMISEDFLIILTGTRTAGDVLTQFSAEAKAVILHENTSGDGSLKYPRIEGIVSLGHKVDGGYVLEEQTTVEVNSKNYEIAREHNEDGTPKKSGTHDVLRITLNGKDPKAIYNFSFAVAPAHYYSADAEHPNGREIDIEENKFGVDFASATFQSKTIQSNEHTSIPVGAGPYKASDASNGDNPKGISFWSNNFVYYKANHNFLFPVKTEKFRYQYVSSANALDKLEAREIDFVTPQFTQTNSQRLRKMQSKGFDSLYAWQLGYGYVGVNAGKVPNINVRKAIMSAMNPQLATEYYETNTCEVIDWPMSNQSWAYPKDADGNSQPNGCEWAMYVDEATALANIKKYTDAAISDGVTDFKFTFTIAGAAISEHPTYAVFRQAVDLLNKANEEYGYKWDVEVKADSQALTKLSTGSLAVWAAAWGSTIDPDMYQVYHKNSSATSVYSWGYREILAAQSTYPEEYEIITGSGKLSDIIDEARSITDQDERAELYQQAMGYVLELAVELPIYQRQNLYAYDAKKLGGINKDVNPYTSPLEKIWNIEIL